MAEKNSKKFFLLSLRALVRPLVRFAVKNSLKVQDCIETLKEEFIREAKGELERRGEGASVSKISVISGIHRRDVDRLIDDSTPRKFGYDLLSKVVGTWQSSKKFSKGGKARALSVEGKESEFFALVQSVSKNLNPYTVLFELERAEAIERKGNFVHLKRQTIEVKGDIEGGLNLLADDLDDLSEGVRRNILNENSIPNLHAKTQFDNIPPKFEAEIRRWFLERGNSLHKEAREYLSKFDSDTSGKMCGNGGRMRAAIGTFSVIDLPPEVKDDEDD